MCGWRRVFSLTGKITFSFPPEKIIKVPSQKANRKEISKLISCGKWEKRHFPRELSPTDKVSPSPRPSQIQTVTSLYGGITAFGNYDGGKMDGSNWKELTSCRARPHSTARTKNIFFEMKLWATPRIIRRVTVYIITHSGHLLMFLFHGGRARPKKKRELTQRVAELCFPLSHSLTQSLWWTSILR